MEHEIRAFVERADELVIDGINLFADFRERHEWHRCSEKRGRANDTEIHATQTVAYSVNNPSTGNQNLNQVTIQVAESDGSPWTSGDCSASDFSVNGEAAGATATDVSLADNLTPGETVSGSIDLAMVETDLDQDDCQGVTVPLYLSAS